MAEQSVTNAIETHAKDLAKMTNPEFALNVKALIQSRQTLIYMVTHEEKRLKSYFQHWCVVNKYTAKTWDTYKGFRCLLNDNKEETASKDDNEVDVALDIIAECIDKESGISGGNIYIMFGFHRFLRDCSPDTERRLKYISMNATKTTLILVGPQLEMTASLEKDIAVLDFPYPNKEEVKNCLNDIVQGVRKSVPDIIGQMKNESAEIIKAANGLTLDEAQMAYCKSITTHKQCKRKPLHIATILEEKKQIIRKSGTLDYVDTSTSLEDVGGLDPLIKWLKLRKLAFQDEAAEYGLTAPKGIILLGIPGTGKSLSAKAVASYYEMPLLRLDFGKLFNSLVGESEKSARQVIQLAEALSPAVLWIDEIEKGLSGNSSSGATDGGTTSRVIGTLLTWLQDKTAPVFIIATANDQTKIPPEFMRAGRFDEVFFVDLPNASGRKAIFEILIRKKKRNPAIFDIDSLISISKNYSGAEIEKSIEIALFEAFQDSRREPITKDIANALRSFKPLYDMRREEFDEMRQWAKERCVIANTDDSQSMVIKPQAKKDLDLGDEELPELAKNV